MEEVNSFFVPYRNYYIVEGVTLHNTFIYPSFLSHFLFLFNLFSSWYFNLYLFTVYPRERQFSLENQVVQKCVKWVQFFFEKVSPYFLCCRVVQLFMLWIVQLWSNFSLFGLEKCYGVWNFFFQWENFQLACEGNYDYYYAYSVRQNRR